MMCQRNSTTDHTKEVVKVLTTSNTMTRCGDTCLVKISFFSF